MLYIIGQGLPYNHHHKEAQTKYYYNLLVQKVGV